MTIRRLFPIILFCYLAILAVAIAPDPDMWWHLRTGEFILSHGLPHADIFSYTVTGHPWLTHEWLTEVIMWTVFRTSGFVGLNLVFAAVVTAAFWLTYLACDGRPYIACLVVSLAMLVAFFSVGIRPQMFNLLFFAAFILVVERTKDRYALARNAGKTGQTNALWLLPVLSALWANLHSGFMLGVVLLATYACGEALQLCLAWDDRRGLDWRATRQLALVAFACLASALLNPNGYRLFTYSWDTLGAQYVAQGWVIEWASPDFHGVTGWPFAAMVALGAVVWAFSSRRATVTDVLLFTGTAAAGLYSARHVSLFAIAGAPVICRSLVHCVEGSRFHSELIDPALEPAASMLRRSLYWMIALGIAVLAIVHGNYNLRLFDTARATKFPVAAVDFIEKHDMAAKRCFNNYGWGGYLIWRGIPVFIDGRADVYGDDFIQQYVKPYFVREDWRLPLDDYAVEYALIERDCRMRTVLLASGEWREVYRDRVASVLVRVQNPAEGVPAPVRR